MVLYEKLRDQIDWKFPENVKVFGLVNIKNHIARTQ